LTASPPHRLTASPPHRLTASPPHRLTSPMRRQRLIALFVLGALLLNYPLLLLANRAESVLGMPVLYVYFFMVWGALVGLATWTVERRRDRDSGRRTALRDTTPTRPTRAVH
ncbi:MAG: hypothetical protein AAFU51_10690, partial [Bacteroidota bacterium]